MKLENFKGGFMSENQSLPLLELTPLNEPQIDMLRGASFGVERIWQIFQRGEWTFYTNGKFTFTSQFSQVDCLISGTYAKVGSNFEFQSGQAFDDNTTISIDGTICINEENLVLDAIYTSSNSPQQIARISQYLTKGRATQKTEPVTSSENNLETERAEINDDLMAQLEALGINDDLIEKEIEGIKIPSQFKISLEGKTNKGAFSSLPGTLFITNKTHKESQSPFSISLAINPDLFGTNGFIVLNSEENNQEDPNTRIHVSNNQVRLEFSLSEFMRSTTYTLGADESSPDLYRQVLIENAILTFTYEGNQISGEIKASGIILPGGADEYFSDAEKSTYEAKLTGEISTSLPVEKLKAALASRFNGQWDALNSPFGQIKLQRNGQQVSGTYTGSGGGTIEGIARGNRLDFSWQDTQRKEKGGGFFRAIAGGGKLVGIWWREDRASQTPGESVIASWQLPSFITTETFSPFDLQELRYLGQELALQHRYDPAALIINRVIVFYLGQQLEETPAFEVASVEKEKELEEKLISAAFSLNFLINCHFQLGDYEQLLTSLDYGLKIQRLLDPEESANRLFRRLTADIANTLTSNAERFEVMEKGYRNWQQVVSGSRAVIGIYLEQDENKEVIVSGIEEKQAAYLAGIMPQDEILKIDGKLIHGLDKHQVLENLGGRPGTLVTITVRRSNQELEFQLTRGKIEINSAQRQAELVKTLTFFADSLNRLRESSKNNLNKINTSAQRIAQSQEEPVSALLSVTRYIENQTIQLNQETNIVINSKRKLFSEQEEVLQELEFIFSQLKGLGEGAEIQIQNLDAREEKIIRLIENDKDLSPIEKRFFRAVFTDIIVRLSFFNELKLENNYIRKTDAKKLFEENRKRAQKMTFSLTDRLESWRTRLRKDIDKIEALDQGQPFFQKALKFLTSLGYEEEALVISEKSRARAFADLLTEPLSSKQGKRYSANTPTIAQIKQIAQEQNATIIEYSMINADDLLLIWVIKPTGKVILHQFDIKAISEQKNFLSDLVVKAREFLSIDRKSGNLSKLDSAKLFSSTLWESTWLKPLYQILIQPIVHLLPTDPNNILIFIPQGNLFLVPFSALQDAEGKFLIEKHTIITAPSIQILELIQKRTTQVPETSLDALVVGSPKMPTIPLTEPPVELGDLAWAKTEVQAIASLLNTQAITGLDASKVDIQQQMVKARLIHLATHGLLDDIPQLNTPGAIALAPSNDDNGFLTASEIYNMKLNAELVVLSACSTGQGKITGDGVIGLSRCLIAAGVKSVIVSLWSVGDLSTALLMVKFYQILQQRVAATIALNEAQRWLLVVTKKELEIWVKTNERFFDATLKIDLRRRLHQLNDNGKLFQHPRYWAAFFAIGQ